MGVSTTHYLYDIMQPNIAKCYDVSQGQDNLRTPKYLPQFKGESSDGYTLRVGTSYLNNKFKDKIDESIGLVLGNGIDANDIDTEYILNDIDANGSTLEQFAQELLRNGEIAGHSFIIVDAPSRRPENLEDQVANNLHPYWINATALRLINWRITNNQLVMAVLYEQIEEQVNEFEYKLVDQYKVYTLQGKTVFYRIMDKDDNIIQEDTATDFKEIPIVPFYANRKSPMTSEPPFLNAANLNINAFQIGSQKQRALLQICDPDKAIFDDSVFAALNYESNDTTVEAGTVKSSTLTFGADIVQVFGTNAKYEFVEPTGKGVELASAEIEKIEKDIDGMGASLFDRANVSATEAEITNTKATAADMIFSKNLEDALNRAYQLTRQVDSALPDGRIKLDRSFAKRQLDVQIITALDNMVLKGNLSKEAFLTSISTGKLPEFVTEDELTQEIERQQVAGI